MLKAFLKCPRKELLASLCLACAKRVQNFDTRVIAIGSFSLCYLIKSSPMSAQFFSFGDW